VNLAAEFLRSGYTLLSRLGEGASSEVFDARHRATARRVAIKVGRADVPEAEIIVRRMQTEWNVGRGLRHPHLVACIDGGTLPDGRAWLAMERLEGRDLQAELETVGALDAARAVHITRQACEALQVLHRRGAVHRDVKPENLFICDNGHFADHVKVIDLGVLALPEDDPMRAHEPTGSFIMGTPLYLAPELARGERPDPRTDLYALGGVLYHLLAGEPPWAEVIANHVKDPVPPLVERAPGVDEALAALVHDCLEKAREDRPRDALAVLERLDGIARRLADDARPAGFDADVPQIPAPGMSADWMRLAEVLGSTARSTWPGTARPGAIEDALDWLESAERTLADASATANRRRARADDAARARIASQSRLDAQLLRVRRALSGCDQDLAISTAEVDELVAERDELDVRYAVGVHELGELGAGDGGDAGAAARDEALGAVRRLLAERYQLDRKIDRARGRERDATEQVALLLAEEVEIEHGHLDLRLAEQDEGVRYELLAGAASDGQLAAQRAFENACLNLYVEYLRATRAR
jgi:serine/threonine-protein kinase